MMEAVRGYLVAVVAVCMITVLASALIRDSKMQRVVRFVGGILILLVAAKPLLSLDMQELAASLQKAEFGTAFDAETVTDQNRKMLAELIKENTETYIEDKAAALGATVQAGVTVSDVDPPIPKEVTVIGTLNIEQQQRLQEYISDMLGIAPEYQEWKLYE